MPQVPRGHGAGPRLVALGRAHTSKPVLEGVGCVFNFCFYLL